MWSVMPASLRSLLQQRDLFFELTRRDIESRYRGSFLGLIWSFINPLLMLTVYSLAFGVFLGIRWPHMASGSAFSLMIFCGMVIHSAMSECMTRAPGVIISQPNLVKRVVFPLPLLSCVMVASILFNMLLTLVVLLLFVCFVQHGLHLSVLYLPLMYIPFVLLLCGVGWFLSAMGVFVRDISQLSGGIVFHLDVLESSVLPSVEFTCAV